MIQCREITTAFQLHSIKKFFPFQKLFRRIMESQIKVPSDEIPAFCTQFLKFIQIIQHQVRCFSIPCIGKFPDKHPPVHIRFLVKFQKYPRHHIGKTHPLENLNVMFIIYPVTSCFRKQFRILCGPFKISRRTASETGIIPNPYVRSKLIPFLYIAISAGIIFMLIVLGTIIVNRSNADDQIIGQFSIYVGRNFRLCFAVGCCQDHDLRIFLFQHIAKFNQIIQHRSGSTVVLLFQFPAFRTATENSWPIHCTDRINIFSGSLNPL